MTLVVALIAERCAIIASDTQVSDGRTRTSDIKVKVLNDRCLWAGAGEVSLLQLVEERLSRLPERDVPLVALREPIGTAVKQGVEELLRVDHRAERLKDDADKLDSLYTTSFAFAEWRDGRGAVLSLTQHGQPEWYTHPYAIGSGSDFAITLMKKYDTAKLSTERAALLSYRVLMDAVEVAQSGIALPLDVWRVDDDGHHQYTPDELDTLHREAERQRQALKELVEQWEFARS